MARKQARDHGPTLREDGYELWLRYRPIRATQLSDWRRWITAVTITMSGPTAMLVRHELQRALPSLLDLDEPLRLLESPRSGTLLVGTRGDLRARDLEVSDADLGEEGYGIQRVALPDGMALAVFGASDAAVLRGIFHLLRLLQTESPFEEMVEVPRFRHRILAHWDNLDGSIERGYAGRSLWQWDELPEVIDPRYHDYARACASIGLNGTCLTNVNAAPDILSTDYLEKVAALADTFRPYGIRVWLAPLWSGPMHLGGLATADPSDAAVRAWWRDKVDEIYGLIPDFAGFQVKADSEGQPGPFAYGADHADGANMLAEALAPHGGTVLWRAFVYDTTIDADRAKCAYAEFVPLDGRFAENVVVQIKNGPVDFQPREPFHPLFGAMPRTPVALELQVTQEYLGHDTHLVYLAPMWKEVLDSDTHAREADSSVADVVDGSVFGFDQSWIIAVSNVGSDRNWCGHHFAQANWYAFGRLATDPSLDPRTIAEEWVAMTWSKEPDVVAAIVAMMESSWPACIDYMTPLGLHHLSQYGVHYGPEPGLDTASREDWNNTYFHRADVDGVGFDRSSTGSGATSQYHPPLRQQLDDVDRCPEEYLLWFHHVPWDFRTSSGRSLLEEMTHRYAAGVEVVAGMVDTWRGLAGSIDAQRHQEVLERLERQLADAAEWRDVCSAYFQARAGRAATTAGD